MSTQPRVLVADDDAFIRRPLELILRQEGFDPEIAVDGDECLEKLQLAPPDLLILDIMMPGRDGFEICRRMQDDPELRRIPVIMLSARGGEHDRERGIALGADEFMTKPYSPAELLRRIRQLLNQEQREEHEPS